MKWRIILSGPASGSKLHDSCFQLPLTRVGRRGSFLCPHQPLCQNLVDLNTPSMFYQTSDEKPARKIIDCLQKHASSDLSMPHPLEAQIASLGKSMDAPCVFDRGIKPILRRTYAVCEAALLVMLLAKIDCRA